MPKKFGVEMQFMTETEYVKSEGTKCPACHGANITGFSVNTGGGGASQEMSCDDCDAEWNDVYTLVGYNELELDTNQEQD